MMGHLAAIPVVGVLEVLVLVVAFKRPRSLVVTDMELAKKAIDLLADWAKWMSGIQTAAIGSLAYFSFSEHHKPEPLKFSSYLLAFGALVSLGSALFCTAWILSSLASITIRLREAAKNDNSKKDKELESASWAYDIYEMPLYGWLARGSKERSARTAIQRPPPNALWDISSPSSTGIGHSGYCFLALSWLLSFLSGQQNRSTVVRID